MELPIGTKDITIPDRIISKWQNVVNIMAEIIRVPSALIMKVCWPYIEVFCSSELDDNPYKVGNKELLASLYCETVIKSRNKLLVPNALKDRNWDRNPDIKSGMISYLGFPLFWPDGEVFGTICVLDSKENRYSGKYERLILQFKEIVELHLGFLCQNRQLEKRACELQTKLKEINTLRGLLPICANCKKIRDDKGYWNQIEVYIREHSEADFSHSICEECAQELYPQFYKGDKNSKDLC